MADALAGRMANLNLTTSFKTGTPVRPACRCVQQTHQVARLRVPLQIKCARVGGVEIPNQKPVEYALQYIYGIGHTTAKAILSETKVDNKRTRELSEEELAHIRQEVDKYTIEGDLRRFNNLNIKRLRDIGCYRGRRHAARLPVRGQNTKNNARTRKGKAIAIAGKKK